VSAVLAAVGVAGAGILAQEPKPAFEVASVRQNVTGGELSMSYGWFSGTLRIRNMPLRTIIAQAYEFGFEPRRRADLTRFKLVGGPATILNARFDIEAKGPEGVDGSARSAMLRSLLADRFKLRMRTEKREVPIYALTARRNTLGPNMRQSDVNCETHIPPGATAADVDAGTMMICLGEASSGLPVGVRNIVYAGPIDSLVRRAQVFLDRPLIDATGLEGNYQWSTAFATRADADGPSMFVAFERDLGLRIEAKHGPYEVFVVESVALPTPN
jgi:uncharacterized protein (TIGR03435 family)